MTVDRARRRPPGSQFDLSKNQVPPGPVGTILDVGLTLRIPPSEYLAIGVGCETQRRARKEWKDKVVLWSEIVGGEHQGKRVPRYFNVDSLDGPPGDFGKFHAGPKALITRTLRRVLKGSGLPVDLSSLVGRQVYIVVGDVTHDGDGEAYEQDEAYSKVVKILRLA